MWLKPQGRIPGTLPSIWVSPTKSRKRLGISLYIVSNRTMAGSVMSLNLSANRQHGIRLYLDEASRLELNSSINLRDGNFAVILSVHHNLHCLVSTWA